MFTGLESPFHLILVLAIVSLLFGANPSPETYPEDALGDPKVADGHG
jgi:hypothetical protein